MDLKQSFKEYFLAKGFKCEDLCVTVKLTLLSKNLIDFLGTKLNNPQKKQLRKKKEWVVTIYRDSETYERNEKREVGNKFYSIDKNSAFIHIFNQKEDFYACDDFKALGNKYLNKNKPSCLNSYNAAIVAPLRYYDKRKDEGFGDYRYFGLIAVDSKNEQQEPLFDNDSARELVGHVADVLSTFFFVLSYNKKNEINN